MTLRIGICEDDDELRGVLRQALEREDWQVTATASGSEAVRVFATDPPDVLVLDVMLPDADGRDVCQALRARGVATPVLFLTALGSVTDRVSGFTAGGDDYLVKPFALVELLVRVQALNRRGTTPQTTTDPTDLGALLDPAGFAIRPSDPSGTEIRLTPTEYRLLAHLLAARGSVARRSGLVAAGWPDGARVSDNTLDAYISRLRTKLRDAGRAEGIENVRGVGYRLG